MIERRRSILALVAAALLWSVGGVLIKSVAWHPMAIMGVRSALAAVTLWFVARRPRLRWTRLQVAGAVAYAVTVILYVPACKLTTAANAILLQYTSPIWIALFGAWFLKERASALDWLFIVLSLGGMAMFFHEGIASKSLLGDLMGALSGVTIAWMMLLMRKQKDESPIQSVLLGNVMAACAGLPFCLSTPLPSVSGWLALAVLGVFQLGMSYALYSYAIRHVTALEANIVLTLEPRVLLLLGERPTDWALAGGVVVLLAVTMRGILVAVGKPSRGASRNVSPGESAIG